MFGFVTKLINTFVTFLPPITEENWSIFTSKSMFIIVKLSSSPKSGPPRPKPKAVPNPSHIGTGVTQ